MICILPILIVKSTGQNRFDKLTIILLVIFLLFSKRVVVSFVSYEQLLAIFQLYFFFFKTHICKDFKETFDRTVKIDLILQGKYFILRNLWIPF